MSKKEMTYGELLEEYFKAKDKADGLWEVLLSNFFRTLKVEHIEINEEEKEYL